MKLLFDQGTPAPLRNHLPAHTVDTLAEKGWSEKDNGELLDLVEREGYEVLVTTDQSLRHQQNLACRRIGIVMLLSADWLQVSLRALEIDAAIAARPTRSNHSRNRLSPSCVVWLEDRTGEVVSSGVVGVALSWPRRKCAGQRTSTRIKRLTPRSPPHHRPLLNRAD